jgi:hypothetical protein
MPYVEGQTIHDADSHIMELPGTINRYIEPKFRAAFTEKTGRTDESPHWSQKAQAQHDDPEFKAGAEANVLLRKNYEALGAFKADDRPKTLDYLGFTSRCSPPRASPISDWSRWARSSWPWKPPAPTTG